MINFISNTPIKINRSDPLGQGLVSFWPCNESGGRIIRDVAGKKDGSCSGPGWVTSKFGPALRFNGSTDYVDTQFSPTSRIKTFSFWLRLDSFNNALSLIGVFDGTDGRFYMGLNATRGFFFGIGASATQGTASNYAVGDWHFMAMTVKGDYCILYSDGLPVLTYNSGGWGGVSSAITMFLGCRNYGGVSDPAPCSMNNVRLYDRVLAQREIIGLYKNPWAGILMPNRRPIFLPSTLKTYNGISQGSIKTMNAVDIASVKTINGLA